MSVGEWEPDAVIKDDVGAELLSAPDTGFADFDAPGLVAGFREAGDDLADIPLDVIADAAMKFDITFDTITYTEGLALMGPVRNPNENRPV